MTTKKKRQFEGVVASKGLKTLHVVVKNIKVHPKYRKQYTVNKKFAVHDEQGTGEVGASVRFEECRPLSKTKRWRLLQK